MCQRETLLAYALAEGERTAGPLFAQEWRYAMEQAINDVEQALRMSGKDPWSDDIKASDEFLTPLFQQFYAILQRPNLMSKTNVHVLAKHVPLPAIDAEIVQVLDAILEVAQRARPVE